MNNYYNNNSDKKEKKLINSNKYINNKNFNQWVSKHTIYNSMLLEDAKVDKLNIECHIEKIVGELFEDDGQ